MKMSSVGIPKILSHRRGIAVIKDSIICCIIFLDIYMFINKYLELFEKLKGVFREIGFCGFLELSIINFPY